MKTIVISCLAAFVLGSCSGPVLADEFKEKIVKEFTPTKDAGATTLGIFNINGFIKVEGYSGNKVLLEIDKTLTADDKATLDQAKQEFKLQFEQSGDSILVYISDPFCSFNIRNGGRKNRQGRCPNWNCCDNQRLGYEFDLDFTIKIPYQMNLYASTINNGGVIVKDVAGTLRTFNINGPITLTNAKGTTEVSTINGNVEVNYTAVPNGKSSYYTLNGDINASYPANLSADLMFKNTNGEFYTNFPDAEVLPVKVTKNQEGHGGGTVYKISKDASVRIGKGGNTYKFETFNGNIYIKKQP